MIKRFFTYMAALFIFAACSDDFEPRTPGYLDEDGTLHLSFGTSPMHKVTTRSGETKVNMYVYDSTGLLQSETLTLDANNQAVTLLNKKVQTAGENAQFYFIANQPDALSSDDYGSEGSLQGNSFSLINSGDPNSDAGMVMSSTVKGVATLKSTVPLWYNGVRIDVKNAVENQEGDEETESGYHGGELLYNFVVQGTAKTSPALAGAIENKDANNTASANDVCGIPDINNKPTGLDKTWYVHPTLNTGVNANKAYVVVQAEYQGQMYFYRLDFQKKVALEGTDPVQYKADPFDIRPHHNYEFLIKDINGIGYTTIEDAAKNPAPMVVYDIHDHSPVIYNMISDGTRELGVSKSVNFENVVFGSNDTQNLKVKLYSPSTSEYDELTNPNNWSSIFGIPENCDWLEVTAVSASTDDSDYGTSGNAHDPEDGGMVFNVTLQVNDTNNPGNLSTELEVCWHGLRRPVKIYWTREFDASKLFSPVVAIKGWEGEKNNWNENNPKIDNRDYFNDFLKNKTIGTSAAANNNSSRADGLHFPMPYGDGTKWTYMYRLTLNSALGGTNAFTWTAEVKGVDAGKYKFYDENGNVKKSGGSASESDRTFYLTRSSSANDFSYETGYLKLVITVEGKEITYDNIKIYHTGFFHQDKGAPANESTGTASSTNFLHSTTSSPNSAMTYYEVVEIGGSYWLDRNMGAKSAESYIKGGDGNVDAQGYYIVAAGYSKGNDPIMYSNITPPGYQVPTTGQWSSLKSAANFSIEQVGGYYKPTARVGEKIVYFTKGKYYEGDSERGEDRAGYYWTRTPASGTEKDEVGNWLKCMQFTGTATSFVNGRDQGRSDKPAFFMPVRAVANLGGDEVHPEKLYFKVKGATHVYLYREDRDANGKIVRTAATTWPGQAIGNYLTAKEVFEFNYESTSSQPEDWFVIFNFVDEDGQINTYSRNDFDGILTSHNNIRPSQAVGWKVLGTMIADLSEAADGSAIQDCGVTINTSPTENGTLWTVSSPIPETKFRNGANIIIRWPKNLKDKLWIWSSETADRNYSGTVWPGTLGSTTDSYSSNGTYRVHRFSCTEEENGFNYLLANTGDNDKTSTYSIPFSKVKDFKDSDGNYVITIGNNAEVDYSIKPNGGGDNPVNKKYRILWSRHGNYYKVKITYNSGGTSMTSYVTPNVSYEQTYQGTKYFCYDFQPTSDDFSITLDFEDNNNDHTKPAGTPTYTAASFNTTMSGVAGGIVIRDFSYGNIVYFEKGNWNWSKNPHAYCWKGDNKNGGWPGVEMKQMRDNIYKYEYPSNSVWDKVIFNNNNGSQTGDLKLVNKNLYKQDGSYTTYTP